MDSQRLVRTDYRVRTAAFAGCFLIIGVHLWEHAAPLVVFGFLALQFLAYPHLVYARAKYSARPVHAELDNLYIDAVLLGAWSAQLGFPIWISYALIGGTTLNPTVNRGAQGALFSLGCSAAGAAVWVAIGGFRYTPGTSTLVTTLCFFGAIAYACWIGLVVHRQTRRLAAARDELARSEERYRAITESAADLVGMVDAEGRWIYTSPSYERLLDPADLDPDVDAFRRVHPDDAELARATVVRVAGSGKPREIALRLVDRAGRIRQYRTRIIAVGPGGQSAGPGTQSRERLLLVSQDVTDLKDSEEQLLLAAHALEGMTEAIMITAADGTVLTVNRAFTETTGYSREDVLGRNEHEVRNALQPPEFYDELYAIVRRDGYWSGSSWCRRKNGSVYREWRSVRAVRGPSGNVTHYVYVFYEAGGQRREGAEAGGAAPSS